MRRVLYFVYTAVIILVGLFSPFIVSVVIANDWKTGLFSNATWLLMWGLSWFLGGKYPRTAEG